MILKVCTSLAMALVLCISGAKAQGDAYTLEVKTNAPGMKLFIINDDSKVDSLLSSNGKFQMKGKVTVPYKASLFLVPADQCLTNTKFRGGFSLYIEPGNILVTSTGNTLEGSVLGGTPLNKDLNALRQIRASFMAQIAKVEKDYDNARRGGDLSKTEALSAEHKRLEQKLKQSEYDFFHSHLNSLVSLDWLRSYLNVSKKKTEVMALFAKMGNNIKQSEVGKEFASHLTKMQGVELNKPAPEFTAKNLKGEDVALKSFRGKYVLIDFWASWCGPCRRENPNVVAAYKACKDKNFTILGVSLDTSKSLWEKAVEKDMLEWEQVSDLKGWDSVPAALYGVGSVPTNFLLDPQGRIIATNLRGEELLQKLNEVLK